VSKNNDKFPSLSINVSAMHRAEQAFTLWELLCSMLVVGIVLGVGIPNFMAFTSNSRMSSSVNDLVSALHLSRTEAVKRQVPITLCRSSNSLAASPSCDDGPGGFFAFTDLDDIDADGLPDGDGTFDDGEEIITQRGAPLEGVTLSADGTYISYGANGFLTEIEGMPAPFGTVLFCDSRGNQDSGNGESVARVVAVAGPGRPQLLRSMAAVAAAAAATDGDGCP